MFPEENVDKAVKYAESFWLKHKEYLARGELHVSNQYFDMYSIVRNTIETLVGSVPSALIALENDNGL